MRGPRLDEVVGFHGPDWNAEYSDSPKQLGNWQNISHFALSSSIEA